MTRQPTLETKNLFVRPFRHSDAGVIKKLAGDRSIADTPLNIIHPYVDGMAEDFIQKVRQKYSDGLSFESAIQIKVSKELVGAVGLLNISGNFQTAELGYWVGKPYWNQGYCTEVAKELIRFGFSNLGLRKIYACHFERNIASGRVMQKLGLKQEGTFQEHVIKWNRPENFVYRGLLKSEWKSTTSRLAARYGTT